MAACRCRRASTPPAPSRAAFATRCCCTRCWPRDRSIARGAGPQQIRLALPRGSPARWPGCARRACLRQQPGAVHSRRHDDCRSAPAAGPDPAAASGRISAVEAWAWHRDRLEQRQQLYDPRVLTRIRMGRDIDAAERTELLPNARGWMRQVAAASFEGFDALICPTVPIVAPPLQPLARRRCGLLRHQCAAAAQSVGGQLPRRLRPVAALPARLASCRWA